MTFGSHINGALRAVENVGGAATVRQGLAAGLLDEAALHLGLVVLGTGNACSTAWVG